MRAIEQAQLLQRKAAQDLAVLRKLIGDPAISDESLGFHAQQAAEKLIKALLALGGHEYPRTHDLGLLLDLLAAVAVPSPGVGGVRKRGHRGGERSVGSAMTLNESIDEAAALGWHPASCKASPTTVAKSETVQSSSWLNP